MALRQAVALILTCASYCALTASLWLTSEVHRAGAAGTVAQRFEALLTLTAAGVAWLSLTWLTVALLLGLLSAGPDTASGAVRRSADRLAPPLIRRIAAALVGVSVAGTWAASPASGAPHSAGHDRSSVWSAAGHAPSGRTAGDSIPDLDRPAAGAPQPSVPWQPEVPEVPEVPEMPEGPVSGPEPDRRATVVVRPGDSLWSIAARALGRGASGPAIRRAWPRWYAANRATVGPNPHLLHPGQALQAPGPDDPP